METVVLTIHLLLALTLILVVLLQRSEGGGLGIGGGGGIMTSRGAATALSKLTWALGVAFVVTSVALTVLAARESGSESVIDRVGAEAPAACGRARDPARSRRRPLAALAAGRRPRPGSGHQPAARRPGRPPARRIASPPAPRQPVVPHRRPRTRSWGRALAVREMFPYRLSPVKPRLYHV